MKSRATTILLAATLCSAAFTRSVNDGVFTKQQAARGKTLYNEECARCHSEALTGGEVAPALVGKPFIEKWNGKPLGEFLDLMNKTMPLEDPGSLSRRQYADLIAYIMSANEFPAGDKDLANTIAELADIKIEPKR